MFKPSKVIKGIKRVKVARQRAKTIKGIISYILFVFIPFWLLAWFENKNRIIGGGNLILYGAFLSTIILIIMVIGLVLSFRRRR